MAEAADVIDNLSDISLPEENIELTDDLNIETEEIQPTENVSIDVEPLAEAEELSIDEDSLSMPDDLSLDVEPLGDAEDLSVDTEPIDVAEELSADIEPLDDTEELSLDSGETETLEPLDNAGLEDLTSIDEIPSESEDVSFEQETVTDSGLTQDAVEAIENIDDTSIGEMEEGGFAEELVNLTDSVDSDPDISEIDYQPAENTSEVDDTSDLASLEDLVSFENEEPSGDTPTEELVSLDDINFSNEETIEPVSDSDAESAVDIAELEAYNTAETEEPVIENISEFAADKAVSNEELVSYENSNIISSENQTPGEIAIDINMPEQEDLGVLYNNEAANIETASAKTPEKGKKAVMVAAAAVAAVMIAASSAYFYFNNKQAAELAETTTVIPEPQPSVEEQPVPKEDVVKKPEKKKEEVKETKEVKQEPVKGKPIESAYLDVKKMGWSVPDYVTYNDDFRHYLQTLGKSMKLALSSDLLLATEYPYSDHIFVDIDLAKTGAVSKVTISQSSGSKQIDDIVLRTVNETTKVVKPPAGVIVGDKFKMTLKIYL